MLKRYKDIILLAFSLLIIFQIYLYTTYPAFKSDDSPETITAAYTLGISHPPGYPLFTMMGKIFTLLPIGSPAFNMNIFAVFLGIIILFMGYLTSKNNMLIIFNYENKILNFFGIFIFAFSFLFWNQAIEAKGGIYMLNLLFFAILIYTCLQLFEKFDIKSLYIISYVYGLSLSNHWPSVIILFPVFGYFILKYLKKLSKKNIIAISILFLTGLSAYLYLPLRALNSPVLNIGNPATMENFWWVVLRTGYMTGPALPTADQVRSI
jgi:hypothetical protein